MKKIEEYVMSIPDFPQPGIIFRDVTSVIGDPDGLKLAIDSLDELLEVLQDYTSTVKADFTVHTCNISNRWFADVRYSSVV